MTNEVRAGAIALLLVVLAAGIGVAMGARARPTPTPRPVPSPTALALASATPVDPAEVERRAFAQPLVTGCATGSAVWLFADGGFAIRYDGRTWTIPDPTLRSILAAECDRATVLAVGRGGSMLTIDDELRQVRPDRFGTDDLTALSRVPAGAVAVGPAGGVAEQSDLGWRTVPLGATEDLYGVAISRSAADLTGWIVGATGAVYRFAEGRWAKVDAATSATLRAVATDGATVLAVGDDGGVLSSAGGQWDTILTGGDRPGSTRVSLRDVALAGTRTFWIVGDRGTAIELTLGDAGVRNVRPIDLGTACTLRAVFTQGSAVWVVGSDGVRGGAWRVAPTATDRWGTC